MKILFVLGALIILSACTVTQPYMTAYTIQTQAPQRQSSQKLQNADLCRDKTLKVSQAFSKHTLMTTKMYYIEEDFHEYAFSESEWSQSPNSAVTEAIVRSVRDSKLFKSVQGHKSRSKSDYVLESSIEEYIQHFSRDLKSSYAEIVINFTLVDTKDSQVIKSKMLRQKIRVEELNAKGGVIALNEGLKEILQEKNIWLSEVCR